MDKTKKSDIQIIKEKLWKFGYAVKDYSELKPIIFDLLVEEKFRVIVGKEKLPNIPRGCDVYAYIKDGHEYFMLRTRARQGNHLESTSPYLIFGRK